MDNCQHVAAIMWKYVVGKINLSQAKITVTAIKLRKRIAKLGFGFGFGGMIPF
jgi:hypothetical protein